MDVPKLKALLSSSESKHILKALIDIRTRVVKSQSGLEGLLEENFVTNLVSLLNRSNPKIIDISLSILANLLQEELARQQIRSCGGLVKLINIVQNIEDNNILCRAWRAVANAAQDAKNIALLHQHGLASHLSQALVSLTDAPSQVVLVRCVRIAGDTDRHRGYLVAEGALERVVNILVSLEDETNHELCKAVSKCLAKLSHGARLEEAEKILPGVAVLVRMAGNARRDLAENCLGVLVNLSQLDQLRPCLGNAEVVDVLVTKFYSCDANSKLKNSVITALCLYCRESVNRVKLREVGGCRLFVEVLSSEEEEMIKLQDMVLNSMLQFIYDNHSLNVLMNEGLIPSLVQMLEKFTDDFKQEHKCDLIERTESETINIEMKDEVTITEEEQIDPTFSNEDVDQEETPSSDTVQAKVDDPIDSDPKSDSNTGPVFRINSPSYQAVQYELEQFMQLRSSRDLNTSGSGSPRWPLSSPAYSGCPSPQSPPSSPLDWTPLSPSSSICQSPDRSPPPLSCGFSPSSSDTGHSPTYSPSSHSPESSRSIYSPMLYSPSASPPYSPPEPNYSPIENFSDEENEDNKEENQDEKGDKKQVAFPEPMLCQNLPEVQLDHSSKAVIPVENIDEPQPSTSGGPESIGPSLLPWTKRTLKIQRTHTYLGQTFTLPPRTRSPSPPVDSPAKRPKLSPTLAYQYAASPLPSPKSNSNLPRQLSRLSVGPPQKVKKPFSRISSIMQILARLSQAERPHADLTSARTITCIFSYMALVHTGVEKSAKIMNRLSTNLYCLFPFILSRHYSFLSLMLEDLAESTMQLGCSKCSDNFQEVKKVIQSVGHNLTLLAETGFGEGEICHRLVHPLASKEDKQFISLSAALLVRQRKMLRNILITHDSLDLLLDILEAENDKKVDEAEDDEKTPDLSSSLFSQAVLSVSHLAAHLGVVSPSLTLPEQITGECHRSSSTAEDNLTLVLDDGSSLAANKEILCNSCPVFAAMFSGSFSEAGQSSIPLPHTSSPALSCLLHYLYTCHLCQQFSSLAVTTLLELVSLSDKYLLPDLNLAVSHCIIRRFVSGPDLVDLYRLALQKKYPVQCGGNPGTLAQATVCTLLVGDMPTRDRVELVRRLVCSQLSGDFIDDVGKMLREKLLERS